MSHKKALEQIAAMNGKTVNAAAVIAIALAALQVKALKGEAAKQAKDKARAEAAIATLERVIANPQSVLLTSSVGDRLPESFAGAVEAELNRMRKAVNSPEALRKMYRKLERG